jgi:hypothetical protein
MELERQEGTQKLKIIIFINKRWHVFQQSEKKKCGIISINLFSQNEIN